MIQNKFFNGWPEISLFFKGGGGQQKVPKPPKPQPIRFPKMPEFHMPEIPAYEPPPQAPPPPPPPTATSADVAQADEQSRKDAQKRKGLRKTVLAGETGGGGKLGGGTILGGGNAA